MSNLFIDNQTQYEFFVTADGSPSICLTSDKFRPEAMHHRQGALAESLFVYHGVLAEALNRSCPPRILSVGLGCAYNEMITVAHFLANSNEQLTDKFYMESFEGDPNLRLGFLKWLTSEKLSSSLGESLFLVFEQVAEIISKHFALSPSLLKLSLLNLIKSEQFIIRDWLKNDTIFTHKFGIIYFDAFSGKSTPELWSELFLTEFLDKAAANENCGLATYAATGSLNRALKKTGFTLAEQAGFSGKRQSTRAFRA